MTDMNKDEGELNFIYSGYGRHINFHLDGGDADYLPKVMATFAEFCRALGFVWVKVDQVPGKSIKGYPTNNYLFSGHYKWEEDTLWAESSYKAPAQESSISNLEEDDEQPEEVTEALENYYGLNHKAWDDDGLTEDEPEVGDLVYYHGRGTENEKTAHGGYKHVPLLFLTGTIIKTKESVLGNKALVRWNNWHDGHNGLGDVPEARMNDDCYFWVFMDNLELANV